jgi:hypothetical protein
VLGTIDLDPASCVEANQVVQAAQIFTVEDDGLTQPWKGRLWLNPPYGRSGLAGRFVQRLVDEYVEGNVIAALTLLNANSMTAKWMQPLHAFPMCITNGRIDFKAGAGQRALAATHGSVFHYLGPDVSLFAEVFSTFGTVKL